MLQTDGSWAIPCKETATKPSQLSKSLMEPVRVRAGVRARVRLRVFACVCVRLRAFACLRYCARVRNRQGTVWGLCVHVCVCVCGGGGWGGEEAEMR